MPYKDLEQRRLYKKRWRLNNKEKYRLGQSLTYMRKRIKTITEKGICKENEDKYHLLLEKFEQAKKEQIELIELENRKINLENEIKRKEKKELQSKEIEELREQQEIIFQEQHEKRLKEKEELVNRIEKLEKLAHIDSQQKYTNAQYYYFKNKKNKLLGSKPSAEQIIKNKKLVTRKRNIQKRYKAMEYVWNYKLNNHCKNCGEDHPAVLCFHHRDPKEKISEIGRLVTKGKNTETIQKEIDKCDLLCQNCHTLLHWKERFF